VNHLHSAHGYVTDTTYAETFFRELSPVWLNYVASLRGVCPGAIDRFAYLELGCGLGNSAITNAGAFPDAEFHACDFNATHIEQATRRAAAFGIANITFHKAAFEELRAQDLPDFDFIVLHGVYSWVGAGSREAIRRIIDQKLKPGGLAYVSYNCWPGWAAEVPLRRLLFELAAGASGDTQQRAESALGSLKRLSEGRLRYFTAHPAATSAIETYFTEPSRYLVHEFLNETWEPFYSVDVADEMAAIELNYLGSATLADNHPTLNIDDTSARAITALPDARQRQLAMDFAVNRRFRRDVFVRAGTLSSTGRDEVAINRFLDATIIGILDHPERITSKMRVPRGAIGFQDAFIHDLQELLAGGSITLAEAIDRLGQGRDARNEIARNLTLLVAGGVLMPFARVQRYDALATARQPATTVVARMLAYAVDHDLPCALPSAIVGNGVLVQPIEALAITELGRAQDIEGLAARVYGEVVRRGLRVKHDGAILQRDEELKAFSRRAAADLLEQGAARLVRAGLLV